jgi:hypothetical protein
MRTALMAGLLLSALLLAGCSGDDNTSDVQGVSTSTETNIGNTTVSGSVSAGPGGAQGSGSINGTQGNASASTSWSYDNRTGTMSGNGAFVNVPITKEEDFSVQDGTVSMYVNVTAEGHELHIAVRAPGCEDNDCATEADTQSGKATMSIPNPTEGDWVVVLELDGVGPMEADYTLEIAKQTSGAA